MAIKKRRPKNQWLMSRRFVSLADGSKKWSKMVNKLHLSGKEQIRLPNNHWFFGRRNCKVHFKKTNGFKASRHVSRLACVFKPMVLRHLVLSHNWRSSSNQWF
jgi:hypothetical protein